MGDARVMDRRERMVRRDGSGDIMNVVRRIEYAIRIGDCNEMLIELWSWH